MSRDNIIQFVETEATHGCLWVHDDAFSYQPSRGLKWLQRACFWVLRRIGCYHVSNFSTYRRIVVDRAASVHEIMRQQANLRSSLGTGGEVLLIGAEDWKEILQSEPMFFSPMAFNGHYYVPRYPGDAERKELRVCVIPWMRGMVLVPREALRPSA